MNTRRCLSCGDPLGITSRADRRTCSDLCRKRVSLASRADRAASAAQRARQAAIISPKGHRPTSRANRESRGSQP
jgi:predicted nucleic acid-binding Zn ribbon protein